MVLISIGMIIEKWKNIGENKILINIFKNNDIFINI